MRCTDESPGACTPLTPAQCIPELLCTECKDSDPKSCIRDKVNTMSPSGIPSFNCPFMVDLAASSKVGCEALTAGESLSFIVPVPCPTVGANTPPVSLRPYDNIYAANAGFVMLDTAKIAVHSQVYNTTQCAISLQWAHGTVAPSSDRPLFVAITTTMGRQIVFPVWASFEAGDCTTPPTQCTIGAVPWPDGAGPADSMMACVR
jgi:hypothetical protein